MKRVYDPIRAHDYQWLGETCIALTAKMGTGGGNIPIVLDDSVQSDKSKCGICSVRGKCESDSMRGNIRGGAARFW